MKQYLDQQQTAKLIELGFEKPKNTQYIQRAKARNLHSPFIEFGEPEFEGSYTIGELIEMLPKEINKDTLPGTFRVYIDHNKMWAVDYCSMLGEQNSTNSTELIDAFYATILQLKEGGVI